jgi:hypothetical protein
MSELIKSTSVSDQFRWTLLTTASALAVLALIQRSGEAKAAEDDPTRPIVWVELGGQLESLDADEQKFVPPFILATPRPAPETISPLSVGHPPRNSFGEEGKISIEPQNSSWVFSAAIRYGRSNAKQSLHQQSYPTQLIPYAQYHSGTPVPGIQMRHRVALQFIDAQNQSSESQTILDFQAGKDVGLGMFGAGGLSVFNFGVRFAQFGSKSSVAFKSDPDAHPIYKYAYGAKIFKSGAYHFNSAEALTKRSFSGVGPSLSWDASASILGQSDTGQIRLDWGVNAAMLFGRQKATVHHQTKALYYKGRYSVTYPPRMTLYRHTPPDQVRARSVVVPNLGGFAGVSFRYSNAKLSLGYRADFFFSAMDGGIDVRKTYDRDFHGPFATISVGLGG